MKHTIIKRRTRPKVITCAVLLHCAEKKPPQNVGVSHAPDTVFRYLFRKGFIRLVIGYLISLMFCFAGLQGVVLLRQFSFLYLAPLQRLRFPDIATSLKFFKEDGRFDVICSGSMLGVNYKKIESNSVGYKTDYEMYSMDFEEFLWAKGYNDDTVEDMLSHMKTFTPFNELEMSVYHGIFLDYVVLGGMPAVVKDYIEKGTFEGSLDTQHQLIADYKEDIRKYAQGIDQTRILNVFNSIASQLAKENKKFQISKIDKDARFRDYRGCAEWLVDAGIVNVCYCLSDVELPLSGNCDTDKFKLYFCDTGLLVSLLDEESQEDLRANKNLGVYKGALYENIVGEALVKAGYKLYYYKKENATLEEDFFIRSADNLIPVEVKAKGGRSKSLRTLISSEKYPDIAYGFKLSANNIGYSEQIYTFPYFCAFLLKRFMKTFVPISE